MRPVQWVKNGFVLAPLIFAQKLTDLAATSRAAWAFAIFCCAASAIYLINDLRDRQADRHHPLKRLRPIAAGDVPIPLAAAAALALSLAALLGAAALGAYIALLVGIYLAVNLLYSFGLKRVVILDVMAVASGYVIRVQAGSAAVDVALSRWLILCTIFLALFLVFSKRRHELTSLAEEATEQRAVLHHYSPAFLDQMINVVTASTVVSYALWAVDAENIARFGSDQLIYTLPFVLFGIFRYLYLTYQRPGRHNPTEAVLKDLPSLLNLLCWGLFALWIVYG